MSETKRTGPDSSKLDVWQGDPKTGDALGEDHLDSIVGGTGIASICGHEITHIAGHEVTHIVPKP